MKKISFLLIGISVSVTLAAQTVPPSSVKLVESYGKLPLAFEANQGQTDAQVKFLSRAAGYSLFLTSTEAVLALQASDLSHQPSVKGAQLHGASHRPAVGNQLSTSAVLRMKLVGANSKAEVIGQDELPGKSNYFIGNDPKKWHSNIPQFAKVRYRNVYPGIDLVYYGHQRELEYDFVVQPGANPEAIRLEIEGARKLQLDHGDLVLMSVAGEVHLRQPQIYQEANGRRHSISARFVARSRNEVGFEIGSYNRKRALIIDPVLAYSTYLEGTLKNWCYGIAADSAGNAYVTGTSETGDFPIVNAIQPGMNGPANAFVTKFNSDGTALVYSTYLGGSYFDGGTAIAVDSVGSVYVTGIASSADFPTVNALQPTKKGGNDAFVTKINPDGTALVYSTYLGGSLDDSATSIAADSDGNTYVTGYTPSTDFPTVHAVQPAYGGGNYDGFVTKINASGSAFVYSTYLGGSSAELSHGIAADSNGHAYVTGVTSSMDFPIKNALQPTYQGEGDAFVTKINASGSALVYSTFLGGSDSDVGEGIAVDATGNAYVGGVTASTDFPTKNALQSTISDVDNAFATKINAQGSALVYSTYLGEYVGIGIAIDSSGNAYVAGNTKDSSTFVKEISAAGDELVYRIQPYNWPPASFAADSAGVVYVTGTTFSKHFPTTLLGFQQSLIGNLTYKGFVSKIAPYTFVGTLPTKLGFPTQAIGTMSTPRKLTLTNQGSDTLTINKIFVTGRNAGDFIQTNNCGANLVGGTSCTVSVTFGPSAINGRKAVLGISDSDLASPQALALIGVGTVVSLSKTKLSFPDQTVGTASAPENVTLKNVGSTQLYFGEITITGTNAGDFSQTNTCGSSIAAGASCTITVTFTPTAIGTRKATVSISDDGGGSPQKVTLTGTGT